MSARASIPPKWVATACPFGCNKTTLVKLIQGSLKSTFGCIRHGGVATKQPVARDYR